MLLNELRAYWQRYLTRETLRARISVKISTDSNELGPIAKVFRHSISFSVQPRTESGTLFSCCLKRDPEGAKLGRSIQSPRHFFD